MQRLYVVLHGTPDSYLLDALHEGGASAVALLHASMLRGLRLLCSHFILNF
jgi:hypothetical protein